MTRLSPTRTLGTKRQRGRPKDPELARKRREQILEEATRVFAGRGFASTDLQDVADELEVGKGTIYRYFPSKSALFEAAVDRVLAGMREAIDKAVAVAEDPLDQVAAGIHAYLAFFHGHPEYVELLIQDRAKPRTSRAPAYFRQREANIQRWHDLYRGLVRSGRLRDVPVERITDVMGKLVYGAMFTNHMTGHGGDIAAQARDIIDVVFHGLLSGTERSRARATMKKESR